MNIPVLLVDDSEFDRKYTSIMLGRTKLPWAVQECESGHEALNAISQSSGHIALILLDLNMPGMNGFEFIEAFERLPASVRGETDIVVLTRSPLDSERLRALAHPVVKAYLVKPLTLAQAQHLGQRQRMAPT